MACQARRSGLFCAVQFFAGILQNVVLRPVLRPVFRVVCGLVAIPVFRFILRKILRLQTSDAELERDLEQWFRASVLLLAATANLEDFLFGWLPWHKVDEPWITMVLRLLLAIGVIESMPDEQLFSILHRGPPKIKLSLGGLRWAWKHWPRFLRGIAVLHLRRSSPMFCIMCVIFGGMAGTTDWAVGWWCYGLCITQYLIIAVVTDRDRAAGLLEALERETSEMREQILSLEAEREGAG